MEAIYAVDLNNGLSKNKIIPWTCKKDMLFFMNKTKNNVVIMGKNTYFSLPIECRPLPKILNIVLSTEPLIHESPNIIFTNYCNIHQMILNYREKFCELYKYLHP